MTVIYLRLQKNQTTEELVAVQETEETMFTSYNMSRTSACWLKHRLRLPRISRQKASLAAEL